MFTIPNFKGTYRLFPVDKNKIMVRLENIADLYDAAGKSAAQLTQTVNLD